MITKNCFYIIVFTFLAFGFTMNAQEARLIAKDGILYAVDEKYGENKIFFYSNAYKKTDLKLEAGEHTFVFSDWKSAYQFTIDMKPNETYHLKKGRPLTLKEGKGKLENVNFKKVSIDKEKGVFRLTSETDETKTAILTFNELEGKLNYRLRRIDDYWGASRLGFHNGMNGSFTIILSPGLHKLTAETISPAYGSVEKREMNIIEYDFKAGKKYKIILYSAGQKVKIVEIDN